MTSFSKLIEFTSEKTEPMWHGIFFTVALFVASVTQSVFMQHYFYAVGRVGIRIRTSLVAAVYAKVSAMQPGTKRRGFFLGA